MGPNTTTNFICPKMQNGAVHSTFTIKQIMYILFQIKSNI